MKRNKSIGFTLIEIMVVVVILGILAAMLVPKIMGRPNEARVTKAKHDITALETALELYHLDNGMYPTTEQGLQALIREPDAEPLPSHYKQGGYLKRLMKDPWGMPYQYLSPGEHGDIDIYSFGADQQPGGEGINSEIGNWVNKKDEISRLM